MNRAVIYTRVSTDDQADNGYSLESQKQLLTKYCEMTNVQIIRHFEEDYSAKTFERPEWKKLYEYILVNKNLIDHVYFVRWDRFSRNEMEAKVVLKQVQKLGININSVEQPIDFNVPENKILLSIYLTIPEIENDKNSIRTTEGSRQARLQGCWTGTAPFGYNNYRDANGNSTLIPNEKSELVKVAFKEVAKGVESIDSVRKYMNTIGLKLTKQGFHNMLRNIVYIGKVFVKEWKKQPAQMVDGLHQPIIDIELFQEAKNILEGKRKLNKKHTKTNDYFPLRGFLCCPACERVLTGGFSTGRSKKKYPYYKCQNGCAGINFNAFKVHDEFERYLNSFVFCDEAKELFGLIMSDIIKEREGDKAIQLDKFQSEIARIEELHFNAQDYFFSGQIDSTAFNMADARYKSQLAELKIKYADLQKIDSQFGRKLRLSIGVLSNLSGFYKSVSVDSKQAIIDSIFPEKLTFFNNQYRTTRINSVLESILLINNDLESYKKKKPGSNAGLSSMAPPVGLEPTTL